MTEKSNRFGAWGEQAAAAYVQQMGMTVQVRNYRTAYGEIDLIVRDGDTLVFVEVKTRRNCVYGSPKDAVDARKQAHIRQAAECFLQEKGIPDDTPLRFDVISIVKAYGQAMQLEYVRDAF